VHPTFAARRHAEAEAAYRAFVAGGFPVTLEGHAETLQCATPEDRANWLIFKGALDDALAAGANPDDPAPIPVRTTANTLHVVTYAQGLQLIADMRAWGFAAEANRWRLKDLIDAAKSNDDLRAIDLTEGWP